MPLYRSSDVSVSTCIELKSQGELAYELDHDNDQINFIFGRYRDYQLELSSGDVRRMIELGNEALTELAVQRAREQVGAS